jgi:predicted O-methyltransferase YrrM
VQVTDLEWSRRGDGWLSRAFASDTLPPTRHAKTEQIEAIAAEIAKVGAQPLWSGYEAVYRKRGDMPFANAALMRQPHQVRSQPEMGSLFAWTAEQRRPDLIVEFGTAFGVSALYWSAGLDTAGCGHLLTFEPNAVWHGIAASHLRGFSTRVTPVLGTFEDEIDNARGSRTIDIAFVDGIHSSDFVDPQVEALIARLSPNGLIFLDDIAFSPDMAGCWQRWAVDERVHASVAIRKRVGILEF